MDIKMSKSTMNYDENEQMIQTLWNLDLVHFIERVQFKIQLMIQRRKTKPKRHKAAGYS